VLNLDKQHFKSDKHYFKEGDKQYFNIGDKLLYSTLKEVNKQCLTWINSILKVINIISKKVINSTST